MKFTAMIILLLGLYGSSITATAATSTSDYDKRQVRFASDQSTSKVQQSTIPAHLSGQVLRSKVKKEIKHYRPLAMSGDAEAQFQLGLIYIDDDLVEDQRQMGIFWVEQAAQQGHVLANILKDTLENEEAALFGC